MFKASKAKTVKEYLANLSDEQKNDIVFLHQFIQKTSKTFKPHFAYNMLGYGSFPYINYKKQHIQWPRVALAGQKNYISLYVCALDKGQYLAEKYKAELGKVSVGKSCIRFKKLDHLNLKTLKQVLLKAVKNPGLTK